LPTWNRGRKPDCRTVMPVEVGGRYPGGFGPGGPIKRPFGAGEAWMTISNRAPTRIRNRALIVLLWRGGLRISEAPALKPKNLDASKGTIRVLKGKGSKDRVIAMDPEAWAMLRHWLDRRERLGVNAHHPVICTLRGEPVKAAYVRALLPRLARRAGIEKRVYPHGLLEYDTSRCREWHVMAAQRGA